MKYTSVIKTQALNDSIAAENSKWHVRLLGLKQPFNIITEHTYVLRIYDTRMLQYLLNQYHETLT